MSMMVSFVLSFFPRDVLDEILKLIESVSEDFPSYSFLFEFLGLHSIKLHVFYFYPVYARHTVAPPPPGGPSAEHLPEYRLKGNNFIHKITIMSKKENKLQIIMPFTIIIKSCLMFYKKNVIHLKRFGFFISYQDMVYVFILLSLPHAF